MIGRVAPAGVGSAPTSSGHAIVVIGATGTVGGEVARLLAHAGHPVRAATQAGRPADVTRRIPNRGCPEDVAISDRKPGYG